MNYKPISKGDLVMVVRDCCGRYVGHTFRVEAILRVSLPGWITCEFCSHGYSNVSYATAKDASSVVQNASLHWLKRIDPGILAKDAPEAEKVDA